MPKSRKSSSPDASFVRLNGVAQCAFGSERNVLTDEVASILNEKAGRLRNVNNSPNNTCGNPHDNSFSTDAAMIGCVATSGYHQRLGSCYNSQSHHHQQQKQQQNGSLHRRFTEGGDGGGAANHFSQNRNNDDAYDDSTLAEPRTTRRRLTGTAATGAFPEPVSATRPSDDCAPQKYAVNSNAYFHFSNPPRLDNKSGELLHLLAVQKLQSGSDGGVEVFRLSSVTTPIDFPPTTNANSIKKSLRGGASLYASACEEGKRASRGLAGSQSHDVMPIGGPNLSPTFYKLTHDEARHQKQQRISFITPHTCTPSSVDVDAFPAAVSSARQPSFGASSCWAGGGSRNTKPDTGNIHNEGGVAAESGGCARVFGVDRPSGVDHEKIHDDDGGGESQKISQGICAQGRRNYEAERHATGGDCFRVCCSSSPLARSLTLPFPFCFLSVFRRGNRQNSDDLHQEAHQTKASVSASRGSDDGLRLLRQNHHSLATLSTILACLCGALPQVLLFGVSVWTQQESASEASALKIAVTDLRAAMPLSASTILELLEQTEGSRSSRRNGLIIGGLLLIVVSVVVTLISMTILFAPLKRFSSALYKSASSSSSPPQTQRDSSRLLSSTSAPTYVELFIITEVVGNSLAKLEKAKKFLPEYAIAQLFPEEAEDTEDEELGDAMVNNEIDEDDSEGDVVRGPSNKPSISGSLSTIDTHWPRNSSCVRKPTADHTQNTSNKRTYSSLSRGMGGGGEGTVDHETESSISVNNNNNNNSNNRGSRSVSSGANITATRKPPPPRAFGSAAVPNVADAKSFASRRSAGSLVNLTAQPAHAELLESRDVSIVAFNLRDFHFSTHHADQGSLELKYGILVEAFQQIAKEQRGTLDSFHGDHFYFTFNAVKRCHSHPTMAATMALKLVQHMSAQSSHHSAIGSRVSCGVATGDCLVGNLGSDRSKRYSVIGTAYTQATVLERLCKRYQNTSVLLSADTALDCETYISFLYLDMIDTPGGRNQPVAAAKFIKTVNTADEWMYELQEQDEKSDYIYGNRAFRALLKGDAEAAKRHLSSFSSNKYVEAEAIKKRLWSFIEKGEITPLDLGLYYNECILYNWR